jgi:LacI family transcriptional regulator
MIDYDPQSEGCDTVSTDEAQAMQAVVGHIVSLGHRRLAYLSGREASAQTWATERREGFARAVSTHQGVRGQIFKLNASGTDGVEVATAILSGDQRPTAVVTATDHEAANVYAAAALLGLSIPGQLSVVGFADLDFAEWMTPPLTTVRQHAREIGLRAANLVLERLEGPARDVPSKRERVGTTLVHRGSTARPSGHP